jgi:quinolinate synthase
MLDFAAAKKAKVAPGADLAKEGALFKGIGPA